VGPVRIGGFQDTVQLPAGPLDWTVSPRVELGYRFPQAFGEILVSYRSVVSEGDATLLGFDIAGDSRLRTRLNLNALDLDYGQHECPLGPNWDMHWRIGARLAAVYYDERAVGPIARARTSNDVLGAGPHAGLELGRHVAATGLKVYGRVEGAALWGEQTQEFRESFTLPGLSVSGANRQSKTVGVPVLDVQAGVSWAPWQDHPVRLAAGYEVGAWWYLGDNDFGARGQLNLQGFFLRGEWGY